MNNKDIEQLYNEYHLPQIRLAFTKTHNQDDAEEVVQDVFTEALMSTAFHAIQDNEHAKRYLEKATSDRSKNKKRDKRKERLFGDMPDVAFNNGRGCENAILDRTYNERLCGDYGGEAMPVHDDYSEDSFP